MDTWESDLFDRENVHGVLGESYRELENESWLSEKSNTKGIPAHDRELTRPVRACVTCSFAGRYKVRDFEIIQEGKEESNYAL
jgi:hypothetical protein